MFRVNKSFIPSLYGQMKGLVNWGNFNLSTTRQLVQVHHGLYSNTGLPLRTNALLTSNAARTLHSTAYWQARRSTADKTAKDNAIPFLQSKAHKFRVDDAYTVDSAKDQSRQRFALPLGLGIFAVIMYFGFFRNYGSKDQSIMGFLTRDIGDRLPDNVRQKIYNEVDQSKLSDSTISEDDNK